MVVCSQRSVKHRARAPLWKRSLLYLCWIRSGASVIRPLTSPRQPQTRLGSGHPLIQVSCVETSRLLIASCARHHSAWKARNTFRSLPPDDSYMWLLEPFCNSKLDSATVHGVVCLICLQHHEVCVFSLQALPVRKGMKA